MQNVARLCAGVQTFKNRFIHLHDLNSTPCLLCARYVHGIFSSAKPMLQTNSQSLLQIDVQGSFHSIGSFLQVALPTCSRFPLQPGREPSGGLRTSSDLPALL